MKINYIICVVTDSFKNKYAVVANELSDTVQICGMRNKENNPLYFESDAYHLYSWCNDNDLNLNIIKMDADV